MSLDIYLTNDACPTCGRGDEVYSANITHNLTEMADAAGIYGIVWRPEENGITKAKQLIEPLRNAVVEMCAEPERFRAFDSPNGWGLYDNFLPWLDKLLAACVAAPEATVRVSR